MAWVVDTCVLLDVLEDDPDFGASSAAALEARMAEGLHVSPVTYAEMAPAFGGDRRLQDEFLAGVGIELPTHWEWPDTLAAHAAWDRFIQLKRRGIIPRRPLADILIGAYAVRRTGLITRNPADFEPVFPDLTLAVPTRIYDGDTAAADEP
ncbi:MAG: type II toxin-antitoxin system VapC family toxin [Thermoanaerobaculia bacterium]